MGIQNKDGALYFATGVDNTGLYSGRKEAIGIIKAMASEITSFDVFGGIGISAGIAFVQATKGAYDFEKQFQQSMKEVATLSNGIKGSLTDYMNQIVDITREIPVQANDAAKALYQIVSAGHDGADGMKILEVSAKAAIGGVTDTATAADTVTTVLNAYKMDASEAQRVSDLLFTTVKLGKTTFGELGHSIAQAAPIAAAYGVEIDQVLAAVASLTKQGTPTAQAMTQIRAAIMATSKVLGDGAFKTRTFQEALEEVAQRAGGSESKLREDITEVEAVNAVLGMTGKNAKSTASDLEQMGNSAGAAEAAFKEMVSSTKNQLQLVQNNITATLRPMGEAILKEVSDIATAFNKAFEKGDVQESMKTLGALVVTVTSAFVGYKGSIIATTAAKTAYHAITVWITKQKALEATNLVLTKGLYAAEATTVAKNTAMHVLLTNALKAQFAAAMKTASAMLTNPYVLAASAVAFLGYTVYSYATRATAAEKAQKRFNDTIKANQQQAEDYRNKINDLVSVAKNDALATTERYKALAQLQRLMPSIFKDMDLQKLKSMDQLELTNKISEAEARRNKIGVKTKIVMLDRDITKYELGLKEASKHGAGQATPGIVDMLNNLKEERKLYMVLLSDIEKEQIQAAKEEGKAKAEADIQNKAFWTKQKDNAQTALDSIASSQKKLMDAGKFDGIDTGIVESYKKNSKLLKEAEKELSVYNSPSKQENLAKQETEAKLRQQKQFSEQLLALRRKNLQDEINLMEEGAEQRLRQIDLDYQKEIDAIKNQKSEWEAAQSGDLTNEQTQELGRRAKNAAQIREKEISDIKKAETEKLAAEQSAWNEYYIKYGEYQEKRKAIMDKYDKQIATAKDGSAEKATLIAGRKAELDDLDNTLMEKSELWSKLFTDFSNRSSSSIRGIIKDIQELLDYMNGVEGAEIPDMFKDNETSVKAINDAMSNLEALKKFTTNLSNQVNKFKKMLDEDNPFKLITDGFKNNDSDSVAKGFQGIASAAKELGSVLNDLGVESDSTAGKVTSVLSSTASYAATGASVGGPWGAVIGGAIGMASGLVGVLGADYSAYNKMKEEYGNLIDVWDELINKKREYINIDYGSEANKAAKDAIDLVNKQSEAYRTLGKERLNSGASAGSHSIGKRMVKNTSASDWQDIANAIGMSLNDAKDFIGTGRMTGLFDLTAKQLEKLKEEAPAFWAKMDDDVRDYLNDIIEGAEQIDDIQEQVKEQLTQVSFDSVFDSFVNTLMNMDSSAEDFANNFEEYMQRAVLTTMVGDKYKAKLQAWYNSFAKDNDDEAGITKEEMEKSQKEWDAIVAEAISERDKLKGLFNWTGDDDKNKEKGVTGKLNASMTEGTANELVGLWNITAMDIRSLLTLSSEHFSENKRSWDITYSIWEETQKIVSNTERTANNTDGLVEKLEEGLKSVKDELSEIKKNTKSNNSSRG